MNGRLANRTEAGQLLAAELGAYAHRPDAVVLGLPRGGVPVAGEVAEALGLPLDVFVVRKLGVPGHEELAMGAIASGGVRVVNEQVVNRLRVPASVLREVTEREERELRRRELVYRHSLEPPEVAGRTVLLIDDGVATGATVRAAVRALRQLGAARIVLGVPVVAGDVLPSLRREADEVVTLVAPESFRAVGEWYDDFSPTSDREVREMLERGGKVETRN